MSCNEMGKYTSYLSCALIDINAPPAFSAVQGRGAVAPKRPIIQRATNMSYSIRLGLLLTLLAKV
jgi:hypothetical protein